MLTSITGVGTVPLAEGTVVEMLASTPYPFALFMNNIGSSVQVLRLQYSTDGGLNWVDYGSTVSIAPGGVAPTWVSVNNALLRVLGSGGGKVFIGVSKFGYAVAGCDGVLRFPG